MFVKHIKDVRPNEVLGDDIFHDDRLMIKKGTALSERMINLLKKRDIKAVHIAMKETLQQTASDNATNTNKLTEVEPIATYMHDESAVREAFIQTLALVGYEHRYGKLLNRHEDIYFLMDLFIDLHKKHQQIDILYALKLWDHYAYVHSFDTFILGTLLARKLKLEDLEQIALGYLLHDIGKMKVSQHILHKQRKLTHSEFELVKKHTLEGGSILRSLELEYIAYFARSHHERTDGSGYPDHLSEKEISPEIKLLSIVDVYSALTLNRPYNVEIPAQVAIEILFRDRQLYDMDMLYELINGLGIYPTESTVLLTDNTVAQIDRVSKLSPTIPYVKRMDRDEEIKLPLDFSVTVSKMIDVQAKTFATRHQEFLDFLIDGQERKVIMKFSQLCDGLRLEDIFTCIFLPAYWKLSDKLKKQQIAKTAFDQSNALLMGLLVRLEQEINTSNHYHSKILLIMEKQIEATFQIKILQQLLLLENIFPLIMAYPVSLENVKTHAKEHDIAHACIIHEDDEQIRKDNVQLAGLTLSHKTNDDLIQILKEITGVKGQSLDMLGKMFSELQKA